MRSLCLSFSVGQKRFWSWVLLGLVVNIIVLWNTIYIDAVLA